MSRCRQGHVLADDGRPCAICRRQHVVAAVAAADPSLTLQQVSAAVDTALPTGAALRSVTVALAADPEALHTGAPPAVGRLVRALVASGSSTFVAASCVDCGRSGRPLTRSPQGGVCARCRHRQSATACAHCGVVKPVAGRTDAGEPICERCRRRDRGQRRCGRCGQVRAIARRARDSEPDMCVNCYRLPDAICHRCAQRRPCNFADSDRPVCKGCTPRVTARCARCAADRPPSARWPEGPVCEPCYRAALHRRGLCAGCRQQRRLVDPVGPEATRCAGCAGVTTLGGHVCGDCGVEDRLFERGRCARCALTRRTHELLSDEAGDIPVALRPAAAAIAAARQPYSALNWLHKGAGAAILADLAAGQLAATHETLDAHPRSRAADYLRRMLIVHGVLAERDDQLVRAERWVADLVATIPRPTDRRVLSAYATWRVLRRLRRRAEHTPGPWTATRHTKTLLGAAVGLLDWLADHDLTLAEAGQDDIDAWLVTGPGAYHVRDFLDWAAQHDHCRPLSVAAPGRRTGVALDPELRWALLARLLHDDTLELTDRVAGCLVLCYAQQLSRITALTTDQITRGVDATSIRFGAHDVNLPEPLAGLLRTLIDTPRSHVGIGAPATSRWLFPGHHPGRPLTPAHLGTRLRRLGIPTMPSRRAALIHLASQLPAAVLADLLNLSVGTAVGWVNNAGGDWSRYAAALAKERHHRPEE